MEGHEGSVSGLPLGLVSMWLTIEFMAQVTSLSLSAVVSPSLALETRCVLSSWVTHILESEDRRGQEADKRQPGYYWNKPIKEIKKTIFCTTTLAPRAGVKLTEDDLLKVTDLFLANAIQGFDWVADLYLVRTGMVWTRLHSFTKSHGWTRDTLTFNLRSDT